MKKCLVILLLFGAGFAAVYDLMPFHDDWCYATAPNPDFMWSQLLPSAAFWRPFDVLWGAFMAKKPDIFPVANRFVIVLAHTFSSLLVWETLGKIAKDRLSRILGTLFFSVSSVIAATLFNSDTINQSWSFLVGMTALYVALDREEVSWCRWSAVNALVFLSMLFKESGVSWLAVIPLVLYWRERCIRSLLKRVVFGAGIFALYFALRFALMGEVAIGGEYYTLGFDAECVVVNFAMSTLLPLTGFDMLAFVCEHWLLMVVSVVAPLVFWGCLVLSAKRDEMKIKVVLFALTALAFAAPHCFFTGHHPAEMHFYPVVFAGSMFTALLPVAAGQSRIRYCGIVALAVLFACGWYDRLTEVYRHSERTRTLFLELAKKQIDFSKPVYFIAEVDPNVKYYSVFTESAAHGLYWGKACRAFNAWRDFDYHIAATQLDVWSIPYGAQTIRIK